MTVRGYFAVGVVGAKKQENVGTLLRSAFAFGAAFAFTVGRRYTHQRSDTTKAWRHLPLYHYPTLDDLLAHLPQACELVGIELTDHATPLPRFVHPERAVYLLGAEDAGLPESVLARCQRVTAIPGAARCLNVSVAGSIVLCDRVTKETAS